MREKIEQLRGLSGELLAATTAEILLLLFERYEQMSAQLDKLTATNADTIAKLGTLQTQVAALQNKPADDLTGAQAQADQINAGVTALLSQTAPPTAPTGTTIASINITTPGSGYTAPVVTLVNADGSSDAASATFDPTTGAITTITPGDATKLYTVAPTVSITDPTGSGAIAVVVLTAPPVATAVSQPTSSAVAHPNAANQTVA